MIGKQTNPLGKSDVLARNSTKRNFLRLIAFFNRSVFAECKKNNRRSKFIKVPSEIATSEKCGKPNLVSFGPILSQDIV